MIRSVVLDPLAGRLFDVALGASVISWAVLGWVHAEPDARLAPARLTVIAVNALVGVLILTRSRQVRGATPWQMAAAIPAFLAGGLAVKLAPSAPVWPVAASVLFVVGALWAASSFLYLGRSFAILPGLREVVTRGPYRLVRHPAYAGELVMIAACTVATATWWSLAIAVAAIPLLILRIVVEERLLDASDEYQTYRRHVRWRLIPGLW